MGHRRRVEVGSCRALGTGSSVLLVLVIAALSRRRESSSHLCSEWLQGRLWAKDQEEVRVGARIGSTMDTRAGDIPGATVG